MRFERTGPLTFIEKRKICMLIAQDLWQITILHGFTLFFYSKTGIFMKTYLIITSAFWTCIKNKEEMEETKRTQDIPMVRLFNWEMKEEGWRGREITSRGFTICTNLLFNLSSTKLRSSQIIILPISPFYSFHTNQTGEIAAWGSVHTADMVNMYKYNEDLMHGFVSLSSTEIAKSIQ